MLRANINNIVTGTILIYQSSELTAKVWSALPYFSISLSLNVLLTLMIVIRLILHTRNIRAAMGIAGSGRLSKAIVTMLIESCALYSVNSLLFIAPWGAHNYAESIFLPILTQTQVRAFSRSRSESDRLANMTTDWIGHRTAARHPTSCR